MLRLANPVQRYDWGSTTAIPAFLGAPADGGPVAEVWMGAHPLAPSMLLTGAAAGDGAGPDEPLDAAIAARPLELLGAGVVDRWGPRLPFLLKLLAADAPLSLQVHPSAAQAAAGYAREEASGPARSAPDRRYRDAWHKPEITLAMTPFQALAGVRPPHHTLAVLEELAPQGAAPPALSAFGAALRRPVAVDAVRAAFDVATGAGADELAEACAAAAGAGERRLAAGGGEHAQDHACLVELQRAHPGDPGVLLSTLLHHLTLQPGQCLYLAPGQLHAYRSGVAVEAMATSDNVLRAGLTHKHVDVAELAAVVDLEPAPAPVLVPRRRGPGALSFQPPVDDVGMDVVTVGGPDGAAAGPLPAEAGPRIVLVLDGEPELVAGRSSLALRRGESVFVPAGEDVAVRGSGRLAVARVGRR